ncbi:MAG: DUF167 domain-containing protein [archaeon]
MIIKVKVKPSSSKQEILEFGDNNYLIYLENKAEDNKANIELINLLSKYFTTPVGRIKIKSGAGSNFKLIEIL